MENGVKKPTTTTVDEGVEKSVNVEHGACVSGKRKVEASLKVELVGVRLVLISHSSGEVVEIITKKISMWVCLGKNEDFYVSPEAD